MIALVAIVYIFSRYMGSRLADIAKAMREVTTQAERHTEVSRGMMNEFYHQAEEYREAREEHRAMLEAARTFREEMYEFRRQVLEQLGVKVDKDQK